MFAVITDRTRDENRLIFWESFNKDQKEASDCESEDKYDNKLHEGIVEERIEKKLHIHKNSDSQIV